VLNKIYLKDYDIEQNEHFVKYVFIPYFKDIFRDLAERSDKKQKGINRIVFIEVSIPVKSAQEIDSRNKFLEG
jgi:hypothetical protein